MQKLGLSQKLLFKLSPQQIQFIKLLQVPTAQLEARIKQELEENPALLEAGALNETTEPADTQVQDDYDEHDANPEEAGLAAEVESNLAGEDLHNVTIEDYIKGEDYAYRSRQEHDPNEEHYEAPVVQRDSLYELLRQQIHLLELDQRQERIAEQVIGSIEEDGYFRRPLTAIQDELLFQDNLSVEEQEVEEVLAMVQQLEPAGIGAVDLQQCLLLQLERYPQSQTVEDAELILLDGFEEFTRKHFDKLRNKLELDEDRFREAYTLITKLNPKPGEGQELVQNHYVLPDFILTVNNGELEVKLNKRNAPELKVNPKYRRMLEDLAQKSADNTETRKETLQFVRSKVEDAKWFIDAIVQRQFTLMKTMMAIAEKQKAFFLSEGDETQLRPMVLEDIATDIGMDISTVSRVANSKYVQTEFGIYPLKYFFSEGITTDTGVEVSNREVKSILNDLIKQENKAKPLSDDKLANLLQERGYNIKRRTVTKYREQLNLPVARLRKELS